MGSTNFQPSTCSHHSLVARGFALASSVWVMRPERILGTALFRGEAALREGRRAADRLGAAARRVADRFGAAARRVADRFGAAFLVPFLAAFLDVLRADFRLALGSSLLDSWLRESSATRR